MQNFREWDSPGDCLFSSFKVTTVYNKTNKDFMPFLDVYWFLKRDYNFFLLTLLGNNSGYTPSRKII